MEAAWFAPSRVISKPEPQCAYLEANLLDVKEADLQILRNAAQDLPCLSFLILPFKNGPLLCHILF